MTRLTAVILLISVAVGSASFAQPALREGTIPAPGIDTVVAVGNSVYEKYRYAGVEAYEIGVPVKATIIFAHVDIPAGAKLVPIRSGTHLKACYVRTLEEMAQKLYRGCLMDDDGDGTFDRVAGNEVQSGKRLPAPVPYTKSQLSLSTSSQDFRQVVTYLGAANGVLRLSYREFMNDMARPAFTEEYTFPLSASFPQPIAFKDVRLTVTAVDGAGLHYRVEPRIPAERGL